MSEEEMIDIASIERKKPRTDANWHRLRRTVVTSTEVAALFDASNWMSAFELWHVKRGNVEPGGPNNDAAMLGQVLEPAVGQLWARKTGGRVRPAGRTFVRARDVRIGASFDFFAELPGTDDAAASSGIVECKAIGWRQWNEQWRLPDGSVEPPNHYLLQAQTQLLLTGLPWLEFAVLTLSDEGRNFERVRIEPHAGVQHQIVEKVRAFWASIAADSAPPPDFRRDRPTIQELFPPRDAVWEPVDDDELARVDDAARRAVEAAAREKAAKANSDAAKAEILHTLRGCDVAKLPSARVSHRADRRGRRVLRINPIEKEEANG